MYILKLFLLIISIESGFSTYYSEIGEQCTIKGETPGTCKSLYHCNFAINEVKNMRQPELCFVENVPVVCCPNNATSIVGGPSVMARHFSPSRQLKTEKMTCTYADEEPFLCCSSLPQRQADSEPIGCPKLPRPRLNTIVQHPAWEKCLSYQQYFNVCVATDETNTIFFRNDTLSHLDKKQSTRIIDGIPADLRQFPHMAIIGARDLTHSDVDIGWIGGGSLISDKFILTAAHVVIPSRHGVASYALLGVVNKTNVRDGLLCNIVKRYGHPHYNHAEDNKDNDIALVELLQSVKFNEFIRPACLPVDFRMTEKIYTIAGWGETDGSGTTKVLLYTHVQEEFFKCRTVYNNTYNSKTMICTQGINMRNGDACQGDSGGPLMASFTNLNRSYSIEGIISFGAGCGKGAGVYTKVSEYISFIMNIVWNDEWLTYKKKMKELGIDV